MRQKLRWAYNMWKLVYSPKALDDLLRIKAYVTRQFGKERARVCVAEITSTVRQLEQFPKEGLCLEDLIGCPTDYHYLVVKPNYVFYRVEGDVVRVIRVLNERQDFLQILFGICSTIEEGEGYWEGE